MGIDNLAIPQNIIDICESRDKAIIAFKEGCKYIALANQILSECGEYLSPYKARIEIDEKGYIKELDRSLWRHAFDKTGLMQFMDAQAKKEFNQGLETEPPAFTVENIKSTFLQTAQEADHMFARGLVNVFLQLSNQHKTNTNSPFKVNPKAILSGMCQKNWDGKTITVSYWNRASEKINDIDRVIKTLDGKKHQPRELEFAINEAFKAGFVYEDAYYKVKGFLNCNMHIEFKRQDLLNKANLIIARYYGDNTLAA